MIKLVFLLSLSSQSFSQNLPDEINFRPYYEESERLGAQISDSKKFLAEEKSYLNQLKKEQSQTLQNIDSVINDDRANKSDLKALQSDLPLLQSEHRQLSQKINRARNRLTENEKEASRIESKIIRERRVLKPFKDQLEKLRRQKKTQEKEIENLSQKIERQKKNLRKTSLETQALEKKIKETKDQIAKEKQKKPQLLTKINKISKEIEFLKAEIKKINFSLQRENQNLASQQKSLSSLKRKLQEQVAKKSPKEEIFATRKAIANKKNEIRTTENKIISLKKNKSGKSLSINSKNKEIKNYNLKIQNIPKEISKLERQSLNFKNKIKERNQQIAQIQSSISNTISKKEALNNSYQRINQKITTQNETIKEAQKKINKLKNRLNEKKDIIQEVSRRLRNRQNRYSELQREVSFIEQEIPRILGVIRDLELEYKKYDEQLSSIRVDITKSISEIKEVTAEISSLEKDKNVSDSNYQKRKNLYASYEKEAKSLGRSQTKVASTLGQTQGEKDGKRDASTRGLSLGEKIGKAESNYWAFSRGEIKGYREGRIKGRSSQKDIETAKENARKKAQKDSQEYANNVLRPRFFEDFYNSIVSSSASKDLGKNHELNRDLSQTDQIELFKDLEIRNDEGPLSPEEEEASTLLLTSLDSQISEKSKNLNDLLEKYLFVKDSENVFHVDEGIPYKVPRCNKVYKNLKVFRTTCLNSYKEKFKKEYTSNKFSAYKNFYEKSLIDTVSLTAKKRREENYPIFYKKAYEVSYDFGETTGQKEIYKEVFGRIYESNYKLNLEDDKRKAREISERNVNNWIKNNATLSVKTLSISKNSLRSGDLVKVFLDLENLSPQELKEEVVLRIEKTKNINFRKKEYDFSQFAPLSKKKIQVAQFLVNDHLPSGSDFSFSGTIYFPGTQYKSIRKEAFRYDGELGRNPAFKIDLDFDETPKVKKFLFGYKTHTLKVQITPKVEDVPEGYTLTVLPKENGQFLTPQTSLNISTGSINYQSPQLFEFEYKLSKKARKKRLNMILRIDYLGKTIGQESIDLLPR